MGESVCKSLSDFIGLSVKFCRFRSPIIYIWSHEQLQVLDQSSLRKHTSGTSLADCPTTYP